MSAAANVRPKGRSKPALLDRLERQAERSLAAMEASAEAPSMSDLNGLRRLLVQLRDEREGELPQLRHGCAVVALSPAVGPA